MRSLTKLSAFAMVALLAVSACGKKKAEEAGGGAPASGKPASGPPCAEAAAAYTKLLAESGGNELAAIKPTPDQVKLVTAKIEARCTTASWSTEMKTCVIGLKSSFDTTKCLKDEAIQADQVVFDAVKEIKAAAPAGGSAEGSASGSAAAGSAAGSAK